jgi:hypothetical protein
MRETGGEIDDVALLAAAERICMRVQDGLSRWFGPYGSMALVNRALTRAQSEHSALAAVTLSSAHAPRIVGLVESSQAHGAAATVDGIVSMLAALADIIARLIGDDLAINILEQSITVSSASVTATGTGAMSPVAEQDPVDHVHTKQLPVDAKTAGDTRQTVKDHD